MTFGFWADVIHVLVFVMTLGSLLVGMWLVAGLFRVRKKDRDMGGRYRGGLGQWSWVAHRVTGVLVVSFLFAHIVDTFAVGFGPELYNETVSLYKQWWFIPMEVGLVAATLFHALNGLRIILFDFWPHLALKQKQFAVVEVILFVIGFVPAAGFMFYKAYQHSPFA